MYKAGIIGAGKVGVSIGRYLFDGECEDATLCGYYSRSMSSSRFAADFTHSAQFYNLENLVENCNILIIATPDDSIAEVWEEISRNNIQNKTVCHLSGSLSSEIFFNASLKGAKACSMHPLMAVSCRETSYRKMKDVYFTLEGNCEAVKTMSHLLESKGNRYKVISSIDKEKYHLASVFMSNLIVGMGQMAFQLMNDCGFGEEEAMESMKSLAVGNMERLFEDGPEKALTGPVERNDGETVAKHLKALKSSHHIEREELDDMKDIYRILSGKILQIAQKKHPKRDYSSIKNLLKE